MTMVRPDVLAHRQEALQCAEVFMVFDTRRSKGKPKHVCTSAFFGAKLIRSYEELLVVIHHLEI